MSDNIQARSNNWAIKHRPQNFKDIILPEENHKFISAMIAAGKIFSLTLSGPAGIGKTTTAKAICNDLNAEVLFLHGSGKDRGIESVKGRVTEFATMMSLDDQPKVIIVDEADNMTHDAQMALRSVIEEVAHNCSFILTCNFPGRILDAIISRCDHIRLEPTSKEEIASMKKSTAKRIVQILNTEEVDFTPKAIMTIVNSNFPDIRKMLNLTQRFAIQNKVDDSVAGKVQQASTSNFYIVLKQKDLKEITEWVMTNVIDPSSFASGLWPELMKHIDQNTLALSIIYLNELQTDLPIVADKHLALIAFCAKLIVQCEFTDLS